MSKKLGITSSMERTSALLERIQLLDSAFHSLSTLSFKILGSHILNLIALRVILVTIIPRKRST